jgi:hypothetical protein
MANRAPPGPPAHVATSLASAVWTSLDTSAVGTGASTDLHPRSFEGFHGARPVLQFQKTYPFHEPGILVADVQFQNIVKCPQSLFVVSLTQCFGAMFELEVQLCLLGKGFLTIIAIDILVLIFSFAMGTNLHEPSTRGRIIVVSV